MRNSNRKDVFYFYCASLEIWILFWSWIWYCGANFIFFCDALYYIYLFILFSISRDLPFQTLIIICYCFIMHKTLSSRTWYWNCLSRRSIIRTLSSKEIKGRQPRACNTYYDNIESNRLWIVPKPADLFEPARFIKNRAGIPIISVSYMINVYFCSFVMHFNFYLV